MTDWFRDSLHDVSSTLTDPSNYMKLDPPTEEMVSLYQCAESCNFLRNGFMVQFTQYSILSLLLGS